MYALVYHQSLIPALGARCARTEFRYETHSIYVFMQEDWQQAASAWTQCVSVALDSGTWPYFLLPHDTLHAVAAVFAKTDAEAVELLQRWSVKNDRGPDGAAQ